MYILRAYLQTNERKREITTCFFNRFTQQDRRIKHNFSVFFSIFSDLVDPKWLRWGRRLLKMKNERITSLRVRITSSHDEEEHEMNGNPRITSLHFNAFFQKFPQFFSPSIFFMKFYSCFTNFTCSLFTLIFLWHPFLRQKCQTYRTKQNSWRCV